MSPLLHASFVILIPKQHKKFHFFQIRTSLSEQMSRRWQLPNFGFYFIFQLNNGSSLPLLFNIFPNIALNVFENLTTGFC